MKDRTPEPKPPTVSTGAQQAGDANAEIWSRWASAEPAVWTRRMLRALDEGVKGGQWFSLIDKVFTRPAREAAFRKVEANKGAPGVDHQTMEMFAPNQEVNLRRLAEDVRDGSDRPQLIRRTWIPKPGSREERPLGIPTVRDRVVQAAWRAVLEPVLERDCAEPSSGFRPERGTKDALRRVDELLKAG